MSQRPLIPTHLELTTLSAKYEASQVKAKANAIQKEIGQLRKAKQDASQLIQQKDELEQEYKRIDDLAQAKEKQRNAKTKTIGNYVEESVPVNDNEVSSCVVDIGSLFADSCRISTLRKRLGLLKVLKSRSETASPTTRSSHALMASICHEVSRLSDIEATS